MSLTKERTAPDDDAPNAVSGRTESATEDHTTLQDDDPSVADDDPSVATVRAALANGTANSYKRSLNTCFIIWTVGRSQMPRRRIWIQLTWIVPLAVVARYYWHVLSGLAHLLH